MKALRKPLSLFMAMLMCLGIFAGTGTTAFAAGETMTTYMVEFPRASDPNKAGWGHSAMNFLGGWSTGENNGFTIHTQDSFNGKVIYCIEPGVGVHSGDQFTGRGEDFWDDYPSDLNPTIPPDTIKEYIGRIMTYGWQGNASTSWMTDDPEDASKMAGAIATQLLVWETVVGERDSQFNHVDANAQGKNNIAEYISPENPLYSEIFSQYSAIESAVKRHTMLPSFFSSTADAGAYELKWDGQQYSLTLTDTNGVLGDYTFSSNITGLNFSVDGNQLTITSSQAIKGSVTVKAEKISAQRSGVVVWTDGITGGGKQDFATYGETVSDSMVGYLNLEVKTGNMKLIKTSEDGQVAGINFTITGEGYSATKTTNEAGEIDITDLNPGVYTVCSTDLPFGSFYLKELSTDSHYLLNGETFPFTFEYGGPSVAVVEISANDGEAVTNELIRGEIKGLKTDENGAGLGGAVIGLFKNDETEFSAENALATATSAEDGSFSFAGVPYGNWVLKELESPEGFILSDEVIPVTVEEDGQVVEISLSNERVYGDLRLTKVDKDYPDNKLTGAEFEVYRDTNGNKELDEGDELLGKLEETSTGIYEMSHILYGGVFVKETKAPEGFLLDENAYYLEITENGKIYEVENEAGIGFTNMAQTGSLRIEKTSSDGKVEGFSFRVTGANGYDQTFKTDKNGEIFIEGLRVGDYTVSEVSDGASANYVLPADKKVTILADKTTVAQMHNELRDTPKTGDDSKPWLWAALMGVSAMGAAALGVAAYVGKRKKDNHTAK